MDLKLHCTLTAVVAGRVAASYQLSKLYPVVLLVFCRCKLELNGREQLCLARRYCFPALSPISGLTLRFLAAMDAGGSVEPGMSGTGREGENTQEDKLFVLSFKL